MIHLHGDGDQDDSKVEVSYVHVALVTAPCRAECFTPVEYGLAHFAPMACCLTLLESITFSSTSSFSTQSHIRYHVQVLTTSSSQVHHPTNVHLFHTHHESRVVSLEAWNPGPYRTLTFALRRVYGASPGTRRGGLAEGSRSYLPQVRQVLCSLANQRFFPDTITSSSSF